MKFSQRIGVTPVPSLPQTEGMSDELRASIWNVLDLYIWSGDRFLYRQHGHGDIENFSRALWFHYFKKPMDSRPDHASRIFDEIRHYFFNCPWYEVYDFLEFVLRDHKNNKLEEFMNRVLERELSAYRYIDLSFVPVTDQSEIEEIEEAINEGPFGGVQAHLKKALEHLSRRENPDYRNSIKESISAVESMAKALSGNPKATLGDALTCLENQGKLHPALKRGFSSIYGYTSDEGGIRHAMLEEPDITEADAKYFLVSCSSFINYLKVYA